MKLQLLAAMALVAAFSVTALAAAEEPQAVDFKAECRKYAQEDGVSADEMESYITQCMEDMAAVQSESGKDEPAEGAGKE